MPKAIRAITRIQDADDSPNLGSAESGKALTWNNTNSNFDATAFEADGSVAAHVAEADPHSGYLLATGTRAGASSQAQTFTNGIIGSSWKPSSDSLTAIQIQNAAGSSLINIDTVNGRIGIGVTPNLPMHIYANTNGVTGFRVQQANSGSNAQVQNVLQNNLGYLAYYGVSSSNYSGFAPLANGTAFFGGFLAEVSIFTQSAKDIFFSTNATEVMRIKHGGNVGIGLSSPNSKLDVAGVVQADGLRLDLTPTSEAITPTHTFTISLNGTDYKVPVVAA